jgi:HD-GYP domain-containing protein (c-di-GMP phosphodiesterase class II)
MEASRSSGKPAQSRVRADQIRVGQPLAFDAYDEHGRLLLKRGSIVHSEAQIERLLAQGVYAEPRAAAKPVAAWDPHAGRKLSVVALLAGSAGALRPLLERPRDAANFPAAILDIVAALRRACRLDADAALGNIVATIGTYYPARHALNCAALAELAMKRLGIDDAEAVPALAGILTMNVSMVDLQSALYFQQGELTQAQSAQVRAHPSTGVALLQAVGVTDRRWLDTVAQHHELLNGKGYPAALAGNAVCRPARVAAMADQYCALVSERAYRNGVNPAVVMKKLTEAPGDAMDATVFDAVRRELGIYPPGALVQLANGETGIVWRRTQTVEQPIVMAYLPEHGPRYDPPRKRLTSKTPYAVVKPVPMNALQPYPAVETIWDEAFEPDALPPAA